MCPEGPGSNRFLPFVDYSRLAPLCLPIPRRSGPGLCSPTVAVVPGGGRESPYGNQTGAIGNLRVVGAGVEWLLTGSPVGSHWPQWFSPTGRYLLSTRPPTKTTGAKCLLLSRGTGVAKEFSSGSPWVREK